VEHAIWLLKGRFQSLKELRVRINSERDHKWAVLWILCCIILHNLILIIEGDEVEADGFFSDGEEGVERDYWDEDCEDGDTDSELPDYEINEGTVFRDMLVDILLEKYPL
jgi:hypothetical protein